MRIAEVRGSCAPRCGSITRLHVYHRIAFFGLVSISIAAMVVMLCAIVEPLNAMALLLIAAFVVNSTWVALSFWNAFVGFWALRTRQRCTESINDPICARTAVVMTAHNEDGVQSVARMRATKASLEATGSGAMFDYFLLSDSSEIGVVAREEAAFAAWQREEPLGEGRVHYRRRLSNWGFKPGNIRDFCVTHGGSYEYMILLDADSVIDGNTVNDLVRVMQRNPSVGILQSLIVGALCPSFFARIFEFGHRHGLRCSIVGAAWWQSDRCQYWGHNAIVRLKPFIEHCEMPYLPGKGPFSGHVLCHDQIEASFMHRAGYEVRVVTHESGSYEGIPPTIFDFLKRNHRWCRGNLKNLRLVGAKGLKGIDRFHLTVVAQRFLAYPALAVFIVGAALLAGVQPVAHFRSGLGATLMAIWFTMFLSPRLFGVVDAALSSPRLYGGLGRLFAGAMAEATFTIVVTAICGVQTSLFIAQLPFTRGAPWEPQRRDGCVLSWVACLKAFWLLPVLALVLLAYLSARAPAAIIWFAPVWVSLFLAIPLAKLSTSPLFLRFGERLCTLPEDIDVPPILADVADYVQADT